MSVGLRFLGMFSCVFLFGCAREASFFNVSDIHWKADAIEFSLRQTDTTAGREHPGSVDVDCLNCNIIEPPSEASVDSLGTVHLHLPEANFMLSARLHVQGRGLDTIVVLKQRSKKEAEEFFKITTPLVGRVLVTQFSILYSDSTTRETATHADKGDELNLFGENDQVFFVHHPLFRQPLYLPKSSGVRLY